MNNSKWKIIMIASFAFLFCALCLNQFYVHTPSNAVPFDRQSGSANYTFVEAQKISELLVIKEVKKSGSGLRVRRRTWTREAHYYLLQRADGTLYAALVEPERTEMLKGMESAILYGCPVEMPEELAKRLISASGTDMIIQFDNENELYAGLGKYILHEGWSHTGLILDAIISYTIVWLSPVVLVSMIGFLMTRPKKDSRKFSHAIPPVFVELFYDGTFTAAIVRKKIKGTYEEATGNGAATVSFMYGNETVMGSITDNIMTIPAAWDVHHGQGTPFTIVNFNQRTSVAGNKKSN